MTFEIDFSAFENEDFAVGKKASSFEKINYLGGSKQPWPIDVRILVNMSNKDEAKPYIDASYHDTMINDQYVSIPCPRSVGETCAICDAHWDHKGKAEKLATLGANSELHEKHAEFKRHTILAKQFEQKKRFNMLVALRGDTKVSVLSAKPSLIKAIFGDRFKNEPGAVAAFKEYGVPVFNPAEPTGWLTLNKTGTGLGTRYSARPATQSKVVNKKKEESLIEEQLSEEILSKFSSVAAMEALPRLHRMNKDRLWTAEEYENYVASDGTQLPAKETERLNKKSANSGSAPVPVAPQKSHTVNFEEDDFSPF